MGVRKIYFSAELVVWLEGKKMSRRFWFLVVLTAVLVCLSFYSDMVFGEPFPFLEGKISGIVIDVSTGQPIDNSMVTVGIGSFVNQTVATNSTGQYYIWGLVGNLTGITYNVTASKTGYLTSSENVILTTVIDFLPPATQNFALTQISNVTPTALPSAFPNPRASVTPTPMVPELSTETLLLAVGVLIILSGVVFKKRKEG
jgi:hypothetical protein